MKPFEDPPSTCGHMTSIWNKPQQQQPGQLSASSLTSYFFLVNSYVQLSFDGEKCVLLLCACKAIFLRSGHILTLHMYITCCNWEIMFSSLFIYYPGRITYKNEVITTIEISVTTIALVCNCMWWQIHCTIRRLPWKTALQHLCAIASGLQGSKFVNSMLHACNYHTVLNIGGEKTLVIWQITAFHQVFLPIFTISITLPTSLCLSFFCQTSYCPYSPKFFTVRYYLTPHAITPVRHRMLM